MAMKKVRNIVVALCAMPIAAFAAAVGDPNAVIGAPFPGVIGPAGVTVMPLPSPNTGMANVPGGITLVPGTVVTPGVSGSSVTGTVPLAGTVGSAGVQDFNPRLGNQAGNPFALYPALGPQLPLPGSNLSTLPQTVPVMPAPPNGAVYGVPSAANCPAGVARSDGTC
jgi:hypothetical protein